MDATYQEPPMRIKARKDPKNRSKSTKVHRPRPAYDRNDTSWEQEWDEEVAKKSKTKLKAKLKPGDDVVVTVNQGVKSRCIHSGTVVSLLNKQFTYARNMLVPLNVRFESYEGAKVDILDTKTFIKYKCKGAKCKQEFVTKPGPVECPMCSNIYVEQLAYVKFNKDMKVIREERIK